MDNNSANKLPAIPAANLENKLIISLIIKDKLFWLCEKTICNENLLTKFVQFRGLTVSEKNDIAKESNLFKRNLKFYEIIGKKDIQPYRQILKVLKDDSNQDVNIIGILEEEGRIKDTRRQTTFY